MVAYRRNRVPGGTYFFTVTLHDRQADLLTRHIDDLRDAVASVMARRPFRIDAAVILPEHLHMIWALPSGDADYAGRWRVIKSAFVRRLAGKGIGVARNHRGEARIWQRRFREHAIADDDDYRRHVDYIHFNPVHHGLVPGPGDWPYSSFHRFVGEGILDPDWVAAPCIVDGASFGEP